MFLFLLRKGNPLCARYCCTVYFQGQYFIGKKRFISDLKMWTKQRR